MYTHLLVWHPTGRFFLTTPKFLKDEIILQSCKSNSASNKYNLHSYNHRKERCSNFNVRIQQCYIYLKNVKSCIYFFVYSATYFLMSHHFFCSTKYICGTRPNLQLSLDLATPVAEKFTSIRNENRTTICMNYATVKQRTSRSVIIVFLSFSWHF